MDASLIIKIAAIIVFTCFIPFTAISFYRFRLKKKEIEYEHIVKALQLKTDVLIPKVRDEYSAADYLIPVVLATLICLLGTIALIIGGEIGIAKTSNLILSGIHLGHPSDTLDFRLQSLLVLTMAFLGAYIWSVQNLLRRLITIDLTHTAYYSMTIRIIMAAFVALMMHFF